MEEPADNGKTRMRVLNAAAELFARQGFKGATVRQICALARVNVASVNYHFKSKSQLYSEVCHTVFSRDSRAFFPSPETVRTEEDWSRALRAGFERLLTLALNEEPPDCWLARLFARERTEPSAASEVLADRFFSPLKDGLVRLVEMGLPPDAPARQAELLSVAALAQCLVYTQKSGVWEPLLIPPGMDRAELAARMAAIVANGLLAQLRYRPRPAG